jgi:nicotinate-nucleotide pyrophosphorylase (carboxylating)
LRATQSAANLNLSSEFLSAIERAVTEDVGSGDVTTKAIVGEGDTSTARIIARQDGIVSGLEIVRAVFLMLDGEMRFRTSVVDGAMVVRDQVLLELAGPTEAILTGERTALNFLGRMSGIASITRKFVDAVASTSAVILDTRKTAPGLRAIDKLAVLHGGGQNHRQGLYDLVLIKNNHITHAGSLTEAVRRVRDAGTQLKIEVEARSIDEVKEALALGVDRILLDNMNCAMLREAVASNAGRARLEASGNVTLENVGEIAATGVDFISVGAITHSARTVDVSLRLDNKH